MAGRLEDRVRGQLEFEKLRKFPLAFSHRLFTEIGQQEWRPFNLNGPIFLKFLAVHIDNAK